MHGDSKVSNLGHVPRVGCGYSQYVPLDGITVVALHDLIAANTEWILSHTRKSQTTVAGALVDEPQYEHGIRLFLTQLCETLRLEGATDPSRPDAVGASAALHGVE